MTLTIERKQRQRCKKSGANVDRIWLRLADETARQQTAESGARYPMSEDEGRVRLVHDEQEPVLLPQLRQLSQGRNVAVHAEKAVRHHDFPCTSGFQEQLSEMRYVIVPVDVLLALRPATRS